MVRALRMTPARTRAQGLPEPRNKGPQTIFGQSGILPASGNIVTFDLERGLKGMNAVNVALEVEKAKKKKEDKETLNTESQMK